MQPNARGWRCGGPGASSLRTWGACAHRPWALLALAVITVAPPASGEETKLGELIQALEAAESAVRTVSVRRVIQYRPELPAKLRLSDGSIEQDIHVKNIGDLLAPWAVSSRYIDAQSKSHVVVRAVWDGAVFRKLYSTKRNARGERMESSDGLISHEYIAGTLLGWPGDYLWWYMGESLSSALKSYKVLAVRDIGPPPGTVVIELQPHDELKMEYHVAPAMGYAVVYRARYSRVAGKRSDWQRVQELRCSDFRELRAGLWLPQHVEESMWLDFSGQGNEVAKAEVASLAWELDSELDAATFSSLEFPSGTLVDDRIRGQVYRMTNVNDQMIADQVAAAKRLAQEAREEASGAGRARMLFAACVAVLIAAAT